MGDRDKATDEQREAEIAFSEALRRKVRDGRPNLEDLVGRGKAEQTEPGEEEREAGRAFGEMLRARLEAGRIKVEDLMARGESGDSPDPTEVLSSNAAGDDAA